MDGQMIGIYFSPRMLHKQEIVEKNILKAKKLGYSWVCFHAGWHTHVTIADKIVHDAIKKSTIFAKNLGMKVMVDMSPEWWMRSFIDYYPESSQWLVIKVEGISENGKFTVSGKMPDVGEYWQIVFEEICCSYICNKGESQIVKIKNFDLEPFYSEKSFILNGELEKKYNGEIIIYIAFSVFSWMDMASPFYLKLQKDIVDMYKDVKLDGIQWDEPGKVLGCLEGYKAGKFFFEKFKEEKGYDLKEKLIYLDKYIEKIESAKIRNDYYGFLVDILFKAQKEFNDYAKKVFGNIEFGIHHTWSGFHIDIKAGCIDYFKLGRNLTASFTDCAWDIGGVAYNYYLSDSIRKELKLKDAYVNDWSKVTSCEEISYFGRLKLLFDLKWKNIYLGEYGDGIFLYSTNRINKIHKETVRDLENFGKIISGKYLPYSEIAIWHHWEGIAYLNKDEYTLLYYEKNLIDFCEKSLENNLWFDFVSTSSLEKLEIGKDVFFINGKPYKVLILPWATVFPSEIWYKIKQLVEKNFNIIFIGPFPQITIDTKKYISNEFFEIIGIEKFTLDKYFEIFSKTELEQLLYRDKRESIVLGHSSFIRATFQKTFIEKNEDGIVFYVKSGFSNVYYFPLFFTNGKIIDLAKNIFPLEKGYTCEGLRDLSPNYLVRLFKKINGDEFLKVVVAKRGKTISEGKINYGKILLKGEKWAILK